MKCTQSVHFTAGYRKHCTAHRRKHCTAHFRIHCTLQTVHCTAHCTALHTTLHWKQCTVCRTEQSTANCTLHFTTQCIALQRGEKPVLLPLLCKHKKNVLFLCWTIRGHRQSQGLLYKHPRDWLINLISTDDLTLQRRQAKAVGYNNYVELGAFIL